MRLSVKKIKVPPEGNVLLLSLFILSTLTIGSAALSTLVIRDIRSAQAFDSGHLAYYAAESGIEQALYEIRRAGTDPESLPPPEPLTNNASYSRLVTAGEALFTEPLIAENDFIEINFFNPTDPSESAEIESIRFDWTDDCGGNSEVELSYTQFPPGSLTWPNNPSGFPGTFWKYRFDQSDSPVSHNAPLSSSFNYRLRLKSLSCDLTNVTLRAFEDDGFIQPAVIPSRVKVESTGRYSNARQALSLTMQRSAPLSGLFDFVIFSEEQLRKP